MASTEAAAARPAPDPAVLPSPGAEAPRVRSLRAAAQLLSARDPVVAALLGALGPPRLRPPQPSHFAALVRAIVYQQLAGPAAAAIHGRLVGALGDVEPRAVLSASAAQLRAVGLSAGKVASLVDLARRVDEGTLVLDSSLSRLGDEEIVRRLSTVRGIGRWTAEMFLLFQLRRLDVWPTGDLGVRRGYGLAWGVPMPPARQLEALGDRFRPYRSIVAWYCWRACELYARQDGRALTG
ncbi:MAG TPA: DNA-3-methyladenine glycosylase 2 family protein [Acidimicrobiales bacterium]|nr:DNA-3-methyladenine glycosylase 2 family protein [Acidimicrobiales bacterium]